MKAFSITLVFASLSFSLIAADTTIVKLMQQVIFEQISPTEFPYFYLLNEASNPRFDSYAAERLRTNKRFQSSIPVDDFIKNIKADSGIYKWSKYHLPRAKCVDRDHLPMGYHLVYIPSRTITSYKSPITGKYVVEEKIDPPPDQGKPIRDVDYLIFSKPIFSDDKNYVLISIDYSSQGCQFIYKNDNGRWNLVCKFTCWTE